MLSNRLFDDLKICELDDLKNASIWRSVDLKKWNFEFLNTWKFVKKILVTDLVQNSVNPDHYDFSIRF